MADAERRWCFADQLGPHFLDGGDQPVLLVESRAVLRRRRFHRQKAHLLLSALRHRAAELGEQAVFLRTDTYRQALGRVKEPLSVCGPTSRAAAAFVRGLDGVTVLPSRGFATSREEFEEWAGGRDSLLMESFYRRARVLTGTLVDGDEAPAGGKWNLDKENREPPPRDGRLPLPGPYRPEEDEIDEEVRADLDAAEADGEVSFVGRDGPRRFPATRAEALAALDHFVEHRLAGFGPYEDAMLSGDPAMSHSLLSAAMNLGLLDPAECAAAAETAWREGRVPLRSAEGYIRQLIGWRDYMWHTYWHFGRAYARSNALRARRRLPRWFAELDADSVRAHCLSSVLRDVRDRGWTHHIPRLMVLGNYALQRGWHPAAVSDWFHRCFVDGYEWVMAGNVIGMSQYADGGRITTKPYAAGGAYINRMSDFCQDCVYRPTARTGDDACPYTAGYWWFLARNEERLADNWRLAPQLRNLDRIEDLDEVVARERHRKRP
ncbi:deoxyribodipyrimidine photolyase-related protein [Streptomyces sp. WMMB 714]|uniref:cryptochrome/photolyase family protein n=1 Tax=Streptomyces sp. WMMB 714 TaxID=1286822 RepID=UPI0005F85BF5|nr:cryptochrome/photolyase family protein [Streptomyces sp. WMMB 714]SCK52982.1 deoxyribodipyrimidine photolyase-related protein [Streptomyces sp. WMMB 714]